MAKAVKPDSILTFCRKCNGKTNHQVEKEVAESDYDEDVGIGWSNNWQIVKCLGCNGVTFRHVSSDTESQNLETGEYYETIKCYPISGENIRNIKTYYNAPFAVRNIYRETIDSYNNGLLILSAAGLRAIIESICNSESISDGPVEVNLKDGKKKIIRSKKLDGKINGLAEKGLLTKAQASILHQHRFLGNDAIHEVQKPSSESVVLAIEIIEHVLDDLYEIEQKTIELMHNRMKKKKAT